MNQIKIRDRTVRQQKAYLSDANAEGERLPPRVAAVENLPVLQLAHIMRLRRSQSPSPTDPPEDEFSNPTFNL